MGTGIVRWTLLLGLMAWIPVALADHGGVGEYARGRPALGLHQATPPPGQPMHRGRYERRQVQRWVAGYYQSVWVPQTCARQPFFPSHVRCVRGHYERRWIPGHYELQEQWVWVPNLGHHRLGRAG